MRKILFTLLALAFAIGLTLPMAAPALASNPGAIWTTNSTGTVVNQNIYGNKTDVYLNGGPHGGAGKLPDGNYWVQVTAPDGTLLGKSIAAVAQVSGGNFVQLYQLVDILYTSSSSFATKGYDDTPNHGNEYKVWVSQNESFPNNESKTDNFKVRHREPGPGPIETGTLDVLKFYDVNGNGTQEAGEPLIDNWPFTIDGVSWVTPQYSIQLLAGSHTVTETILPGWGNTTPASVTINIAANTATQIVFGNVILLRVTKTANPTFTRTYSWAITKDVDKTSVKQVGGTATFNYTVKGNQTGFTDSNWMVAGNITVTNPSDFDVTGNVTDSVPGGTCVVTGGTNVTVPANGSVELPYSATFASQPPYNTDITNTATATWSYNEYISASVQGNATFQFTTPTTLVNKTVTITDTFNGSPNTLGTLTATDALPYASATFTYARTVPVPQWNCVSYINTARIVETGQLASQTVTVCGPAKTGALSKGFWRNRNGQCIISGSTGPGLRNWLRDYKPFQDLSATATPSQVATYVSNVIDLATARGATMNPMLKAQMLATALDVYFSDPALGGNRIGAPKPIGGVCIDLTKIYKDSGTYEDVSSSFGGASSLTVLQMLTHAASQSNPGGTNWYGQVKATQELAKDAFDAIDNQWAFSGSCP